MTAQNITINSEKKTSQLAILLAELVKAHHAFQLKIYLSGDLGAGKTAFLRFFLEALGVTGRIKSPTYTLIEPYLIESHPVYHIDLYRVSAQELHDLGFLEEEDAMWLIEWPEKGAGVLPPADLNLSLTYDEISRQITIMPNTEIGQVITEELIKQISVTSCS